MSDTPTTDPAPPRPRRRPVRLAYRLFTGVLAIAGLVLLVYVLALPSVVRRVTKSALADLGYPDAVFEVRTATLWAVELADVRPLGGAGQGVIRRAMVRYSPIEVFAGRLRTIELTGADVPLLIQQGQVRFTLQPRRRDEVPAAAGSPAAPKPLPFNRLEIVASTLLVEWENRQTLLPVSGTVTPDGTGGARIELATFFQGTTIPIAGTVDSTGNAVDLTASATNLSVSGIRTVIPWALMSYPFQTSGRADVRLSYRRAGDRSVARLRVEPKNIWLAAQPGDHQLAVQRVDGSFDAEIDGAQLGRVEGTLRIGKVAWDAHAAESIELAVRGTGQSLDVEGRLASEGWRMTGIKGNVQGFAGTGAPLSATLAFDARGRLPSQITRELTRRGVVTDRMGDASAKVQATFTLRDDTWRLDVPTLNLALDPGAIAMQEQGVQLAEVTANVTARATAGPTGATVTVLPNSRLSVAAAQGPGWSTKPQDPAVPVLDVGITGEPVTLVYQPNDSNDPWRMTLPHLRATVTPATVEHRSSRTNLRGLQGVLNVGGDLTPEKVTMLALADSWFSTQSLQTGGGDSALRAGPARLAVLPAGQRPLFETGPRTRVAARLRSDAGLSLSASGVSADAKELDVLASADLSHAGGPAVLADVRLDGATVKQGDAWSMSDIAALIPVAWNAVVEDQGSFTVGSATVGQHKLPSIRGTAQVADTAVAVTAEAEIAKGALVQADGEIEWTPTGLKGRAAATMPAVRLDDDKALGRTFAALADVGITGTFGFDGQVQFNGPLVKPRITATVKDARITSAEYDLDAQGVNGSVTVDRFDPVSGPGRQRLTVENLHLGKLDMAKGSVDFRIERPDSLHVERARWSWVGGQVYTYDLRINPAQPQQLNAVVYADRLDLKQLLGALAQGEASGQGQLYGRLPVRINWPDVTFGQGFLYATGSGQLSVEDNADTVEKMLDQTELGRSGDARFKEVKDRIIQALRNFNYDTLKVDFIPKDGGLTASITVVGKGGTGPTAQELNLTVNINGIDQVLSQALVIRKALESIGR